MSPSKQNSLKQTDKAITRPKSMGTNASQPSHGSHAECFSNVNGRQAHWSAAPYLYERGVWIGYLAPSSHKHSYRGLPSLNELRSNFSSFATPFPETIQGKPNEERLAVCRGCLGDDSTVFAISELKFVKPKKIVVLPLKGEDKDSDSTLFCILIPQPLDRSTPKIMSFRPWEVHGEKDVYRNNFIILSLRNASKAQGVLETIKEDLKDQLKDQENQGDVKEHDSALQKRLSSTPDEVFDAQNTSSPKKEDAIPESDSPLVMPRSRRVQKSIPEDSENESDFPGTGKTRTTTTLRTYAKRFSAPQINNKRKEIEISSENNVSKRRSGTRDRSSEASAALAIRSSDDQMPLGFSDNEDLTLPEQTSHQKESTLDQLSVAAQPGTSATTNTARGFSALPTPSRFSAPRSSLGLSPTATLTTEQAECIWFMWKEMVSDTDFEFYHCLAECREWSFAELMAIFREDADDPEVEELLPMFDKTTTWRFSYEDPKGVRSTKAYNIKPGNEGQFNRMMEVLAQADFWKGFDSGRVNINMWRLKSA